MDYYPGGLMSLVERFNKLPELDKAYVSAYMNDALKCLDAGISVIEKIRAEERQKEIETRKRAAIGNLRVISNK